MEKVNPEQSKLTDQLKDYVETRIKLARYQAIDKGTSIIAGIVVEVVVILCILLTFFFASVTLALFLGFLLKSYWMGFGCVALLYLLVVIIVSAIKNKTIEPMIINFLLKKIFKQKD